MEVDGAECAPAQSVTATGIGSIASMRRRFLVEGKRFIFSGGFVAGSGWRGEIFLRAGFHTHSEAFGAVPVQGGVRL